MNDRLHVVLALLLAAAVVYLGIDQHRAGYAAAKEEAANQRATLATHTVKVADIRYVHDSVPAHAAIERYAAARIHDTVTVPTPVPSKPDSVTVYVERAAADTAVHACTSLLNSCDVRVALRDTLISSLRLQLKAKDAATPSRWKPRVGIGIGAGIDVNKKPNAIAGITFGWVF
jgi:hypothetical protein